MLLWVLLLFFSDYCEGEEDICKFTFQDLVNFEKIKNCVKGLVVCAYILIFF